MYSLKLKIVVLYLKILEIIVFKVAVGLNME